MKLFIVATPIGNLDDISERAKQILREVDLIAAEDTRHSAGLLRHLGVSTPLVAYHDHNEREASAALIDKIASGMQVALISDAGTPLISDPGYRLVREAHARGVDVIPVPGASALIAGLSASGLPTDRFLFLGFLPAKSEARKNALLEVASEQATLVFYESRHRIEASISEMANCLGADRPATLARELTKKFEQICHGTLGSLKTQLSNGEIPIKGEYVVMVGGAPVGLVNYDHVRLMQALLSELPPRKAAGIASQLTGEPKKLFYDLSLELKES